MPAGEVAFGMAPDAVRTVAGRGRAAISVRGSEFVAYTAPAADEAAATAVIEEVRAAHPDATHVVPAYRVRDAGVLRAWSSDADEPTGSAGKPVRTVLERRGLEDVVVAVARYFGGTELGVGGLARAYARAATAAVDDAGVVERAPMMRVTITVEYDDSGTVRGVLESAGVTFEADYAETARFEVQAPADEVEALLDRLRSATGGRATIEGH